MLNVFSYAVLQEGGDPFLQNEPPTSPDDLKLRFLVSKKKCGNNDHVKRGSPVNIDGRRKAKMSQNDQSIAERDEN